MGKKKIIWFVIGIALLLITVFIISSYNKLVKKEEVVKNSWAQVENQYQRRLDLVPNLVKVVQGYVEHERETLEEVVNARSKAMQTSVSQNDLTSNGLEQFEQVQGQLTQALSKFMVVIEQYPNLKADKNFIALQGQLEGVENRIMVERRRFNDETKKYNTYIRKVPINILANIFGFRRMNYFKADSGAEKAQEVKF